MRSLVAVVFSYRILARLHVHRSPVVAVCFSPDGSIFVSASSDGCVSVWDTETLELISLLDGIHSDSIVDIAFSKCGSFFATGSRDGMIVVLSTLSLSVVFTCDRVVDGALHALCLSDDGSNLYFAGW